VRALGLELFAAQPADGVTVVKTPEGIDGVALVSKLEKQYGIRIAGGQDLLEGKIFRIAHMGYVDQFDVLAALSALEMVLLEMGFSLEPGSGVAAAQQVLTQSVRMPRMV
jgi:aspartate aminotransferase-like enzyme